MLKDKRLFLGILISIFLYGVLNETPIFAQDTNVQGSRLSGVNRYTTSAAISKEGWTQSSTVIIATGMDYADALAASSLAKLKASPILLTQKNAMDESVITEIKRLKASQAILVGGAGVIGTGVENQLKSLNVNITRINGSDRYDTSRKVAEIIGVKNGIVMSTGLDYPDALSIAPISGIKAIPILLSPKNSMNLGVAQYLKTKDIPVSYIVGGTGVIGSAIASSLPNSKRLGGTNRYDTNLIINKYFENDLNFDTIYLATGSNFPDAIAGSALAAKNNAPIILVRKDSVSSEIISFLSSKNVKNIVALGGSDVVSEKIVNDTIKSLNIHPSSISLNNSTDTLMVQDTATLIETISPVNVTNKSVIWTSSNNNIVTVDNVGKITAVSEGSVTIMVKTIDGSKTANCNITVEVPLSVVSIE